jgi:hypothetical protein
MKKKIIIALVGMAMLLTGCQKQVERELYLVPGYYYANGEVVTEDGNVWGYTSESINGDSAVDVLFDSNGTEAIYDDIIVGIINK